MSYIGQEKLQIWDNFKKNKKNLINGITITRLNKLEKIIWNDDNFWFFIKRKPEEMFGIVHGYLLKNKIIK